MESRMYLALCTTASVSIKMKHIDLLIKYLYDLADSLFHQGLDSLDITSRNAVNML